MRVVLEEMVRRAGDDRGGVGAKLGGEGEGVGLQRLHFAVGADDAVFVAAAGGDVGDEQLPHADVGPVAHRVAAAVPVVPIADHGDCLRARRPEREVDAGRTFVRDDVGAHLVVEAEMVALRHQHVVNGAEYGAEAVRVGHRPFGAMSPRSVKQRLGRAGDDALE